LIRALPVLLGRLEHQRFKRPGESEPYPIYVPREGEITDRECYVPAGWCVVGGQGLDAAPETRIWVDAFVITRDPVSVGEFARFVEERLSTGEPVDTLLLEGQLGVDGGRVVVLRNPDLPARGMTWKVADSYARWRAEVDRLPWRLPEEYEWEKAGRGADGRPYPWGHRGDPCLAAVVGSGATYDTPVGAFPHDVSVYGVRGLVGHVHEYTATTYSKVPPVEGGIVEPVRVGENVVVVRGGNVSTPRPLDQLSTRWATVRDRVRGFGFRMVRSIAPPAVSIYGFEPPS
jgi:serine/threonine-protein kinase